MRDINLVAEGAFTLFLVLPSGCRT